MEVSVLPRRAHSASPSSGRSSSPTESQPAAVARSIGKLRRVVAAIERGDEQLVTAEVLRWSRAWRPLAPLALCIGAFVMLFEGLRRLWTNWRLILVEAVPAMWAWAIMLDLRLHVFGGRGLRAWSGPLAFGLAGVAVVVTVAALYLNTVFAFALAAPGAATLGPAFGRANGHVGTVVAVGVPVGAAVGAAAFAVPRFGLAWFTLALGVAAGAEMLAAVVLPARLVGARAAGSPRRDRFVAGVIAGVLGAIVCAPSYALGRVGIMLLGSSGLVALGVVLLVIGFTLQSGTAGAVKAIKVGAKAATHPGPSGPSPAVEPGPVPAPGREPRGEERRAPDDARQPPRPTEVGAPRTPPRCPHQPCGAAAAAGMSRKETIDAIHLLAAPALAVRRWSLASEERRGDTAPAVAPIG